MGNGNVNEENNNAETKPKESDTNKIIATGRNNTFQPINSTNNNENNKPITFPSQHNIIINKPTNVINKYKDNNLVLTDYFDQTNDKDKEELDRMNYKYKHSFYEFKTLQNPKEQLSLIKIREKINSEFGLMQAMKNDFDKMKTCLLYCSNLNGDDESFINRLEFYDFYGNHSKNKEIILTIINKNKNQIPELISNLN